MYSNPNATQDLQPLIFQAVARILSQHPILSTVFLDADTAKPRYAQLPQVDLRECIVFVDRDARPKEADATRNPEWDQLLEEYHNTRFDDRWGERPLWRLVISRQPDNNKSEFIACFVYLHGLCDGNSGPAFHRALLAELQSLSREGLADTVDPIVRSPDTPPLPNIEALHRLPLSAPYLLKMAWQDTFPGKNKNVWLGGPVSATPTRSRFRSMTLPADTTSKLVAVSRAHASSLTATVHALVGTALFANLPQETTLLKSGLAVNLRRFLSRDVVNEDSMGNWVYVAYDTMSRPNSTATVSWEDAQHVKKLLDDEIAREGKNIPMACLRYAGNMHKFLESRFKRPRDGSYLMSNLGVFQPRDSDDNDNKAGPSWKTGRMIFSEGFDVSGEAIDITMITGCDGCLTVGFIWSDLVVEEKFLLDVFNTLEKLLVETAQQETKA